MGLLDQMMIAARAMVSRYARYESDERALVLTQELLGKAAAAGIESVSELKGARVAVAESALDLHFQREDGLEVHAQLEPTLLEVWSDRVRVSARVPGGIRAGHQNAVKSFFVGFLDRALGLVKDQLKAVPGLELDGELLVYERALGQPLPLVAILGIDAARSRTFPLRIRNKELVVQLGDAVPRGASIDVAALATLLMRG